MSAEGQATILKSTRDGKGEFKRDGCIDWGDPFLQLPGLFYCGMRYFKCE